MEIEAHKHLVEQLQTELQKTKAEAEEQAESARQAARSLDEALAAQMTADGKMAAQNRAAAQQLATAAVEAERTKRRAVAAAQQAAAAQLEARLAEASTEAGRRRKEERDVLQRSEAGTQSVLQLAADAEAAAEKELGLYKAYAHQVRIVPQMGGYSIVCALSRLKGLPSMVKTCPYLLLCALLMYATAEAGQSTVERGCQISGLAEQYLQAALA